MFRDFNDEAPLARENLTPTKEPEVRTSPERKVLGYYCNGEPIYADEL